MREHGAGDGNENYGRRGVGTDSRKIFISRESALFDMSQFGGSGRATWFSSPEVTSRASYEQAASRANEASHERGP